MHTEPFKNCYMCVIMKLIFPIMYMFIELIKNINMSNT